MTNTRGNQEQALMSKQETHTAPAEKSVDTYVILFFVALVAWLVALFVPAGLFETPVGQSLGVDQFRYAGAADQPSRPLFGGEGEIGFLNFLFEGLVSGDRYGATVGLMAFILIVGGSFGMIMHTGVVERAIHRSLAGSSARNGLIVPGLFILFSLCGAIFGMSEETIVFALIVIPALRRIGYDSLTGLMVTYVATQIGFATSWMNPFGVVIAQGIAGVPALSGMEYRLLLWAVFTLSAAAWTMRYAARIKADPVLSPAYASDECNLPVEDIEADHGARLSTPEVLILLSVVAGIGWIVWGVIAESYYLAEIATQFFAMGLVATIIAITGKMHGASMSAAAEAFRKGATQLAPAAIVVGIAKGIVILLGGDDPGEPSVLNTLLFHAAGSLDGLAGWVSAWLMYLMQSILNLFVVSGSGQAALTMPLMTPLGDLAGVSRQTTVLAFQLGDGLTNIICPASAALMGCLGVARLDWLVWARFIARFLGVMMVFASLAVIAAALFGYQ